jgi:hypothetical protein
VRGKQAAAQSASIAVRVESTRAAAVANRQAQIDVALFTQWVDAYARDEGDLASFYRRRFREEFVPAFEAWVATKPRQNPKAPLSPFAMPQYKLAASAEADALEAQAGEFSRLVQRNIDRSDTYMLAVVLFAISLFFALAQVVGATGPWLFASLIGDRVDPSPARLATGYLVAAAMMVGAGLVQAVFGVEAARRSLEDVAAPLSTRG